MARQQQLRGFAAVDLAAMMVIATLLVAYFLIAGSNTRRLARLGEDVAHLKEMGAATGQYQADNSDLFWTFSWQHGHTYQTQYPDLNNASDDLQAATNQAVYILRTKAGRTDIAPILSWFPHLSYSHLVLVDYLRGGLPSRTVISSGDRFRLQWASDPACFDTGCFACQPTPSPDNKRWPYSSSFMPGMAFIDQSPAGFRVVPSGTYNTYAFYSGSTVLGGAALSGVAFPSQKVLLSDQNARHFGSRQPYCTHPQARLPLLMADGSVPVRSAADANYGWNPNQPVSQLTFSYTPGNCWEPAALSPSGDVVWGRFRFTRQGIAGRDFGGPEVQ